MVKNEKITQNQWICKSVLYGKWNIKINIKGISFNILSQGLRANTCVST